VPQGGLNSRPQYARKVLIPFTARSRAAASLTSYLQEELGGWQESPIAWLNVPAATLNPSLASRLFGQAGFGLGWRERPDPSHASMKRPHEKQ